LQTAYSARRSAWVAPAVVTTSSGRSSDRRQLPAKICQR
jgi:hypothetical protein